MSNTPENRDQLIGLLSTTSGYSDRHPTDAEEILTLIKEHGMAVVVDDDGWYRPLDGWYRPPDETA